MLKKTHICHQAYFDLGVCGGGEKKMASTREPLGLVDRFVVTKVSVGLGNKG